ncbi:hypothetical protein Zm00014a_000693 [Zea mays]|uniref:Uncharacterized protein n=1 Tax=Zea mays TaxID=4577 RepID=A0A3L6E314_MAIZE|nr:hypothetical protein Zm00014a_000693 [Zea mays]
MSLCRSNRINMSDPGTSSRGTRQRSRVQEATTGDNKDSSCAQDMFMQKLKMAAENKVHRELNLDAAKKFLSAYES